MKKLLFILLLACNVSFGQTFSLKVSSHAFVNNSNLVIGSQTYNANILYVIFVGSSASGTPTDNPSVSAGGMTLTKWGTITSGSRRIIAYTLIPASNTTTTITFGFAEAQLFHYYGVYESSNQIPGFGVSIASGAANAADPSLTVNHSPSKGIMAFYINDKNPFAGTAPSGWTEDYDGGLAGGGGVGNYFMHRDATTDKTFTVTSASSDWLGMAVQIFSRRLTIID